MDAYDFLQFLKARKLIQSTQISNAVRRGFDDEIVLKKHNK